MARIVTGASALLEPIIASTAASVRRGFRPLLSVGFVVDDRVGDVAEQALLLVLFLLFLDLVDNTEELTKFRHFSFLLPFSEFLFYKV